MKIDSVIINELKAKRNYHFEGYKGKGRGSKELYLAALLEDDSSGAAKKVVLVAAKSKDVIPGDELIPAAVNQTPNYPLRCKNTQRVA